MHDEADQPVARLLLAHGAGAPMDHPWMTDMVAALLAQSVSVSRFEFDFMAARRSTGKRRPAPRGEKLMPEYHAAINALINSFKDAVPLYIGGKSLGGRVASMVADELCKESTINGCICFGYPFHPAGKPDRLRTTHLEHFRCPMLIAQGTRDALGARDEVASYTLDHRIKLVWLDDGDHDLKPRKKSGATLAQHQATVAQAVREFALQNGA